jgi:hypothetical protein
MITNAVFVVIFYVVVPNRRIAKFSPEVVTHSDL